MRIQIEPTAQLAVVLKELEKNLDIGEVTIQGTHKSETEIIGHIENDQAGGWWFVIDEIKRVVL